MQLISDNYKELNEKLHKTNKEYGKSGKHNVDDVLKLSRMLDTTDILDYGCGKSTLQQQLPFKIQQYDPAVPKYSKLPSPADIVVCTDVLEHIEPDNLANVLLHIHELTKRAAFLVIATRPAKKILEDGRNAHLIIKDMVWWLGVLKECGFQIHMVENKKDQEFKVICTK
jgi:2-polyprenyl-3-methyl-5-hydroxy-6-metoxy-1,4-benzoquinol methylase